MASKALSFFSTHGMTLKVHPPAIWSSTTIFVLSSRQLSPQAPTCFQCEIKILEIFQFEIKIFSVLFSID